MGKILRKDQKNTYFSALSKSQTHKKVGRGGGKTGEMASQYADFEKSSFLRPRPARSNLALPKVCKLDSRQDGRTTLHLDNEVQQWSEHMLRVDLGISPGSVSCQRCGYILDRSQAILLEVHQTVYPCSSRYSHYR